MRIARGQSTFKWIFVGCFALALEGLLFWLFHDAFRFLQAFGGMGTMIIHRLFSLFYLGIGGMLILSSIAASCATVFRSEEVSYLLTVPVRNDQIVSYKFLEAAGMASWAFFVFIVPFVGAYAVHTRASPLFLLWAVMFSVPFLVLCCALGALAVFPIVRWVPQRRVLHILLALSVVVACVAILVWPQTQVAADDESRFDIARLVPGLKLSTNAFLPSWWASQGMISLTHGQQRRGWLLWTLLASSATVLFFAVEELGRRVFYESWLRVSEGGGRSSRKPLLLSSADRAMRFLPHDVRAMLVKDTRVFLRDPVQWSQALVFFGLLGLYFANIRTFNYHNLPAHWTNAIAFLNLFSVSAVVCSLGSRFVFPQLSLEGQGFWILGLTPTTMRRIVLTKFGAAAVSLCAVNVILILLSSVMLENPPATRTVAVAVVVCVSIAVSAVSTGLGAIHLDLEQRNPAAIVSGFGGTFNLVVSLGYMLGAILPFAAVFHFRAMGRLGAGVFVRWLVLSVLWLICLTVIAVLVPLFLGIRSLREREF